MSRRYFLAAGLLVTALAGLFLLGQTLFVGTPRRPMTEEQVEVLIQREVPANADVSLVKTWLDARQIEHSRYDLHEANGASGTIHAIIRDTGRPGLFITADTQLTLS